jgi:hypothetical protein
MDGRGPPPLSALPSSPVSPPPSAAGPPPVSEESPVPPEFLLTSHPWPCLDRLGLTQAIGGLARGLIALFTSYDHITFAGRNIPIPQQWGIPLIAASLATVFTGCVQYGAPLGRDCPATLNWRRDPGYEQQMSENQIAIERSKERTKQIESEILRVRNDSKLIEKDTEQIEKETEQLYTKWAGGLGKRTPG